MIQIPAGYAACPHCARVYRVIERRTREGVTYCLRMHWRTPSCYQQTSIEKAAIHPTELAARVADAKRTFADALGTTTAEIDCSMALSRRAERRRARRAGR